MEDGLKKRMCMEFISHLTRSLEGDAAGSFGLIPVLGSNTGRQDGAVDSKRIIVIPKLENWPRVEDVLNRHIRSVVLGEEQPAGALEEAQREIDAPN